MAHGTDVCRGVLASLFAALVVRGRGPGRADSAATDRMFLSWLFGPALRMIGMIEVDRASPDFRQIDRAAARDLAAGHSLLAYPEGTTSPDGTIGEFKDGTFIIAIASQVPIVPAAISIAIPWPPVAMSELVTQHGPAIQATARRISARVT